MERFVNKRAFKAAVSRKCNWLPGSMTMGEAKESFTIYLIDGRNYKVKEGYLLNWEDDNLLQINETRSSNGDYDKMVNGESFLEVVMRGFIQYKNVANAHFAKIEWAEIDDIQE